MDKINVFAKKVLSADLRAQIKAGLRNNDLSLTAKGIEVLNAIVAEEKATELTVAANEIISESEKK